MSVIENIYNNNIAIFGRQKDTYKIKIGKAVTQMDTINPKLFRAFLEIIFQKHEQRMDGSQSDRIIFKSYTVCDDILVISGLSDKLQKC